MIDLNAKIFLKKSYFSLFVQHFTEEEYVEYVRAVIDYCLYKKCEIRTIKVYVAFMFTKRDIDRENKMIKRNQDNAKNNVGRPKAFSVEKLVAAIHDQKLTTYKDLQNHFGVSMATINRRIKEIKDGKIKQEIISILKGEG